MPELTEPFVQITRLLTFQVVLEAEPVQHRGWAVMVYLVLAVIH